MSPAAAVGADPSEVQQLKDQLSKLIQQVAILTTQRASGRSKDVTMHVYSYQQALSILI